MPFVKRPLGYYDSDNSSERFVKDSVKIATGTFITQLISIFTAPILTRIYGPNGYGLSALFFSMSTIIGTVACLRYELSIVLPKSNEGGANQLGLCILVASSLSLILTPIMLIFGQPIANALGSPQLSQYLVFLPLAVLLIGLTACFTFWNTRTRRYGNQAISRIVNSSLAWAAQLAIGLLGFVAGGGLIAGWLFGYFCGFIVLASIIWWNDFAFLRANISFKGMKAAFKQYIQFPIFDTWTGLIGIVSSQLPVLLLALYFSSIEVGSFYLAYSILNVPVTLMGSAIGQVMYQRSAMLADKKALSRMVETVFSRLLKIGMLPFLLIMVIGPGLFTLVFGSEWSLSGQYAQILALWLVTVLVTQPLTGVIIVCGKIKRNFYFNAVLLTCRLTSLVIGGVLGSPILALLLFASSSFVIMSLQAAWVFRLSKASVRRAFAEMSPFTGYSFAILGATAIVAVLLPMYHLPLLVAISGMAVYYFMLAKKDDTLRSLLIKIPGLGSIL